MEEYVDKEQDDECLSEDSSFYGSHDQKEKLEVQAEDFDIENAWRERKSTLAEIAATNLEKGKTRDTARLYNPYKGMQYARQLKESVDEFLKRLPPATTSASSGVPWIFIANPFIQRPSPRDPEYKGEEITQEGPAEEHTDLPQFQVVAGNILEELEASMALLTSEMAGKPPVTLNKAINLEKAQAVKRIHECAVEMHVLTGKWILFVPAREVNAVWSVVARATITNDLGISAKVAPQDLVKDPLNREPRVICIYTQDFTDLEDIMRVLKKLKDLNLFNTRNKAIYYKMDAYTHLTINSGNKWGIKASLYGSTELLKSAKGREKRRR